MVMLKIRGGRVIARILVWMLAVPAGLTPSLLAFPRDSHDVLWAPLPADQRLLPVAPEVTSPGTPSPGPSLGFARQGGGEPTPPACVNPINEIVAENCQPGTPRSVWDLPFGSIGDAAGDPTIQGFTTAFSINKGPSAQVRFKVDTSAAVYRLEIYRMGYYNGLGARRISTIDALAGHAQPPCLTEEQTGLIDCGNWSVSATWTVPAAAVSGIYFAKAIREDTGGASHILFVIRDDAGQSDLLFQTADTTWQAYNDYGGNSLYTGSPAGRAYKVSYNRPFRTRAAGPGAHHSWVFSAEYPMVRWLEANGYDVSYTSGIDTDRAGVELTEHRVFLSVGHDEYWSGAQRANVEAARDAGVHLAFFSGNEVFWKTRWEPSIDGSNTPYRTLVSYKETHANGKIDPEATIWTGTWRDPRPFNPEGAQPENALTGTIFMVNGERDDAIMVPASFGRHRFWRNTSIAALPPGQTAVLPPGTLGYEWDEDLDNGARPAGLQRLSSTTIDVTPKYLLDYGSNYGVGTATHSLTLYRAPSNALVFGAGTVQWSWGLDTDHDNPNGASPSLEMRQATVNLFADMGVLAWSLQPGLQQTSGTSDHTPPTSAIVSPPVNATVQSGDPIVISGTASDAQGVLASVEVSVDGGITWLPATGQTTWQFAWTPTGNAPVTILSRAIDDSGNVQTPPASRVVSVVPHLPLRRLDRLHDACCAGARRFERRGARRAVPGGCRWDDHRHSLLQRHRQHRHARRQPMDRKRYEARRGDLRERNPDRLAERRVQYAGRHRGGCDIRRVVLRAEWPLRARPAHRHAPARSGPCDQRAQCPATGARQWWRVPRRPRPGSRPRPSARATTGSTCCSCRIRVPRSS